MAVFQFDDDEGWVEPVGEPTRARGPSVPGRVDPSPTPPRSRPINEGLRRDEFRQPATTYPPTRTGSYGGGHGGGAGVRVSGVGQQVRRVRLGIRRVLRIFGGWHESVFRAVRSSGGWTLVVVTFLVTTASPARGAAEGAGGAASWSATTVGRVVQGLVGLLPDWPALDALVALEAPAVIPAVVAAVTVGVAALRRPRSSRFLGGPR